MLNGFIRYYQYRDNECSLDINWPFFRYFFHYSLFVLWLGAWSVLHSSVDSVFQKKPAHADNLCKIFKEYPAWYSAAKQSSHRWSIPIPLMMAVIRHESSFDAYAKPNVHPKKTYNSAYGYAQAKKTTWQDYVTKKPKHRQYSRANFKDAIDFVGWYLNKSRQINHLKSESAARMYVTYHEGWRGYMKQSWRKNKMLLKTANKVAVTCQKYRNQLKLCARSSQDEKYK